MPVGFAAILVGIKAALESGSDTGSLESEIVPPLIFNDTDTMRILSFSDYVTAILAERKCISLGGDNWRITGIPDEGYNWQVPFVKCDARMCEEDGEDAYDFCNYPMLAVGSVDAEDTAGQERAKEFKDYIEGRYPELLDSNMTHFPSDGYEFVKLFESDTAIHDYVTGSDYGNVGSEEIGLAVTFEGGDPLDFKYSLRVNSTNFNSPELAARPGAQSTPDTKTHFATYAKIDNVCEPSDGPEQGRYQASCTGQYIYNGFLTTQRLVHDWIMIASGAKDAGGFVAEYGVRCKSMQAFSIFLYGLFLHLIGALLTQCYTLPY